MHFNHFCPIKKSINFEQIGGDSRIFLKTLPEFLDVEMILHLFTCGCRIIVKFIRTTICPTKPEHVRFADRLPLLWTGI